MNYAIFKYKNFIIVVAEFHARRFKIIFKNGELQEIWTYYCLPFNDLIKTCKDFGFKQVKKFTVRQDNEKNV